MMTYYDDIRKVQDLHLPWEILTDINILIVGASGLIGRALVLMSMLVIASACKNMWVSLGIGVILVFTLSILPQDNTVLSLFPFSSPYQTLAAATENSRTTLFLSVCGVETVLFGIVEMIYLKVRRCFE